MSRVLTRSDPDKRVRANGTPLTAVVTGPKEARHILQKLVENGYQGSGIRRTDGVWDQATDSGSVTLFHIGGCHKLTVKVTSPDQKEGLWLESKCQKGFSLKTTKEGNLYTIHVDCRAHEDPTFQAKGILSLIVRGIGWKDRAGHTHKEP